MINDLIDLDRCRTELITGYPNLQFGSVTSPMSMMSLKDILNQLRYSGSRSDVDVMSNLAVVQQQRAMVSHETFDSGMMYQPGPAIAGEATEDLYFYQLPPVTLKKGDRGYYAVFTERVPYEHIYLWDIPDTIDPEQHYYNQPPSDKPEVVWHALKLRNTTDRPWTTAPAMTRKGGRLLGQDTMYYTAPDAPTELKITQAPSIHAEQNEYEIERQRNAANFYNRSYDLVSIRGELTVTNYHGQEIHMKITKTFQGKLVEAEADAETVKLAKGLKQVNPKTKLTWRIDVEPGKDRLKTIVYQYQTYVRN